jgi:hypothetical protein
MGKMRRENGYIVDFLTYPRRYLNFQKITKIICMQYIQTDFQGLDH